MTPSKDKRELVETNLKYVGPERLKKMSRDELEEILDGYVKVEKDDSSEPLETKSVSKEVLIEELLRRKKSINEKAKKTSPLSTKPGSCGPESTRSPSPSFRRKKTVVVEPVDTGSSVVAVPTSPPPPPVHELPDGEKTKLIPSGEEGVALEVTVAKKDESTRVFKERHELRVCSFNSLKLRTGKAGLEEQWLLLVATLSTFDIVLVQEVPAEGSIEEIEKTRAYLLKKAFEHHSNDEWNIVLSEPCGPGNLEVHVALVRKPIEIVSSCTNRTACSVPMDHAPLTIKVKDKRFKNECDQTWVMTSVHFPPKSRARDRDVQIKAFLKEYATQSAFRLDTPLTEKGAKDAKILPVHHLVCGDFNAFVGVGYELERHEFAPPLLGEHVSTTSGGQSYDNFIMSKFAANKFSIGAEVLELAMPAVQCKGDDGLSDHNPIVVCVKDTCVVKKRPGKAKKMEPKPAVPEEDNAGIVV